MQILFAHEKVRPQQEEFIEAVLQALEQKKNILLHAPTGIGKTAGVLGPAISYAQEHKKIIFFVTPKHTQHKIALETIKEMQKKYNMLIPTANLVGKKHLCAQNGTESMLTGEFHEFCKNHVLAGTCSFYLNCKEKEKPSVQTQQLVQLLQTEVLAAEEMKTKATAAEVCPYEITLFKAAHARVIVADYNHILDEKIRENLLKKLKKGLGQVIVILDEAHNIPNKARELLSTSISTRIVKAAATQAKKIGHQEIADQIIRINSVLEFLAKKMSTQEKEIQITRQEFLDVVTDEFHGVNDLVGSLLFVEAQEVDAKEKAYIATIIDFITRWQGPDEGYVRLLQKNFTKKGKINWVLQYQCLDPSFAMVGLKKAHSVIAMSGTLEPLDMYNDLLGISAQKKTLQNPFPKENKLTMIVPKTTTKFTERSQAMFTEIAKYSAKMINAIPGNSILFFPSYQLRDEVQQYLEPLLKKTSFTEHAGMTKEEKNTLLEKFKSYKDTGAVLLAASTGNFGEGIDLKGDFLKGVIIVGIPLGPPDIITKEIIKYYDKKFNKGWEYGYTLPAMIKTMQNAGRCIRSETDRGVVVFVDERYAWKTYNSCFKNEEGYIVTDKPEEKITAFFKN